MRRRAMPNFSKTEYRGLYSVPPSSWIDLIDVENWFSTKVLKIGKIWDTSDLVFNGYSQQNREKSSTKIT